VYPAITMFLKAITVPKRKRSRCLRRSGYISINFEQDSRSSFERAFVSTCTLQIGKFTNKGLPAMPQEYRYEGLGFFYPENWTLEEEIFRGGEHTVVLYPPDGGFFSVSFYSRHTDPEKLAQAAVAALKEEYKGVDVEAIQETVAGWELTGYDMAFFYLDLITTAQVRCLRTDRHTLVIYCQAEDRQFEKLAPVFRAILTSLVQSIRPLRYGWPQ